MEDLIFVGQTAIDGLSNIADFFMCTSSELLLKLAFFIDSNPYIDVPDVVIKMLRINSFSEVPIIVDLIGASIALYLLSIAAKVILR